MISRSTKDVLRRHPSSSTSPKRWRTGLMIGAAAVAVGFSTLGTTAASAAPARSMTAHAAGPRAKSPVVVKAAKRKTFGTILVTAKGGALYRDTNDGPNKPTCTGSCASVWPPLVLPAGDTTPMGGKGVTGLGTVKLKSGQLQVTFNKEPLYTFVDDTGKSVNGNGDGPFLVVPA